MITIFLNEKIAKNNNNKLVSEGVRLNYIRRISQPCIQTLTKNQWRLTLCYEIREQQIIHYYNIDIGRFKRFTTLQKVFSLLSSVIRKRQQYRSQISNKWVLCCFELNYLLNSYFSAGCNRKPHFFKLTSRTLHIFEQ